MLTFIIKYFFVAICSFYLFRKLLNLPLTRRQPLWIFLNAGIIGTAVGLLRTHYAPISILLMGILIAVSCQFVFRQELNLTVTSAIISLALSQALFIAAILLSAPLCYPISKLEVRFIWMEPFEFVLQGLTELLICFLLFRIKRLRRGMPFLQKHGQSDAGTFLSMASLLLFSLLNPFKTVISDAVGWGVMIIISLFAFALYFWWRHQIKADYIGKQQQRYLADLQKELERLQADNAEMAKLIHKDNKLIPAMMLAVEQALMEVRNATVTPEKLDSVLQQLHQVSDERKGILQYRDRHVPDTGVGAVNTQLEYMSQKAMAAEMDFQVSLTGNVPYLTAHLISESDLNTLIADLCENAIIALKEQPCGHIMVSLGMIENTFSLCVYDDGIPFSPEVLLSLGKERHTTHKDHGGSGIGWMTIFEIAGKVGASIRISELSTGLYRKAVCILFDGKFRYTVESSRPEVLALSGKRSDMLCQFSSN